MHQCIETMERTAHSGEIGKYIIVSKKGRDVAVNVFIDSTCEFVNNSEIPEEIKHQTFPKVRGTSNSRWALQVQEYTKEIILIAEEEVMPSKPPNYLSRQRVTLNNNPFPNCQKGKRSKERELTRARTRQ